MNHSAILSKLLCPPGDGVFTIHTGQHYKQELQQKLYGSSHAEAIRAAWSSSLETVPEHPLVFLGVPSDTGGGIQRGANWGPLFIRQHLLKYRFYTQALDIGDIRVVPHALHDRYLSAEIIQSCRTALFHDPHLTLPVSPLSMTEKVCQMLYQMHPKIRLFSLGGDHSVSYPLVTTFLQHQRTEGRTAAVIHFDAHTDLLASRLGFDYCFGTWAYHILKELPHPSHLVQIGIRSSGKPKEHWESTLGVKQIWAQEVQDDLPAICEKILHHLAERKVDVLYLSFDIDALDSEFASATGTPEPNGLTPTQATKIIQALKQHYTIQCADLVEVAPWVHHPEMTDIKKPQETTLEAALKIINSILL